MQQTLKATRRRLALPKHFVRDRATSLKQIHRKKTGYNATNGDRVSVLSSNFCDFRE